MAISVRHLVGLRVCKTAEILSRCIWVKRMWKQFALPDESLFQETALHCFASRLLCTKKWYSDDKETRRERSEIFSSLFHSPGHALLAGKNSKINVRKIRIRSNPRVTWVLQKRFEGQHRVREMDEVSQFYFIPYGKLFSPVTDHNHRPMWIFSSSILSSFQTSYITISSTGLKDYSCQD